MGGNSGLPDTLRSPIAKRVPRPRDAQRRFVGRLVNVGLAGLATEYAIVWREATYQQSHSHSRPKMSIPPQ